MLFGSKSQTEVMSASPWCVCVKNLMLKFESLEKLHLAEGTWRLWSLLLIWEWVAWSALFSFLVPMGARVLARLRVAKSASTGHMEKKAPIDQCKFSFFLRFCCLVTNFWEMVSGGGKHISILKCSVIDDWYGCAKKTWVLPTAELLGLQHGTSGPWVGQPGLVWLSCPVAVVCGKL